MSSAKIVNAMAVIENGSVAEPQSPSGCYQPMSISEEDLRLMRLIDELRLKRPFYTSHRIQDDLQGLRHPVNLKKVQRAF